VAGVTAICGAQALSNKIAKIGNKLVAKNRILLVFISYSLTG
jgi:hypothetical protein